MHGSDSAAHAYLDGARAAWKAHPEWMDFLDPDSPAWHFKRAARDIYLDLWGAPLAKAKRVLDIGCGVGRFTELALGHGADVWAVDADLASLQRCAWHCAGQRGRLDLHWSSVHTLPAVQVDLIIACEILCYVPDVERALEAALSRLEPEGTLLLSMEARWGWALAEDAPQGGLDAALSGAATLDMPGDRWVRTWEARELRSVLEEAGLMVTRLEPTHYVIDGPLEQVAPVSASLEELLEAEQACRAHAIWGPLNRIWTVVARR